MQTHSTKTLHNSGFSYIVSKYLVFAVYDNVIIIESNNIKLIVAGCFFYVGNDAVYESVTQMEETGEGTVYFLNIKEQYKI